MEGGPPGDIQQKSLVGQTLGERWRVVRLLGRGGMSTVYEVVDPAGSKAAAKVLEEALARSPRVRERFVREARIAGAIRHPNAVRVFGSGETQDGQLYLLMELLEGQTLRSRSQAAGGSLEVAEVLRIADGILEVLEAAHADGVLHRDVKPGNVFLTRDGCVKLLDFGVAAIREGAVQDSTLTHSGVALGTPAFMAPEQARGKYKELDARSDIWAVGATMYFCLTGRHVHEGATNASEALIFAATQHAPLLSLARPEIPAEIAHVVDRALALSPKERWTTARAMREAIAVALLGPAVSRQGIAKEADVTAEGSATTDSPPSLGAARGFPWRAVLFGGAAVTVLATVALVMARERHDALLVGDWGCLDAPPLPSDPGNIDVELVAFDAYKPFTLGSAVDAGSDFNIVQYVPLPGMAIQACTAIDSRCMAPATPAVVADQGGKAHLTVPGTFTGLYAMSQPDSFPGLYYPGRLVAGEKHVTYPVTAINYKEVGLLGRAVRVVENQDPNVPLGHLFVTANDCADRQMPGIAIELPNAKAGLSFYLQNDLPNPAATQTGSHGAAGFVNIPEGNVNIVATRVRDRRVIGTMNVLVRGGMVTFVDIRPRVR